MTKRYAIIITAGLVMLVAGLLILLPKKDKVAHSNDLLSVDLHTLKMTDGWGYEVLVDNKVYIHQDCIPAISSYKRFVSESEALAIGNKVVEKIKKGHKPTVTEQDLNESHIHY